MTRKQALLRPSVVGRSLSGDRKVANMDRVRTLRRWLTRECDRMSRLSPEANARRLATDVTRAQTSSRRLTADRARRNLRAPWFYRCIGI